MQSKGAARPLQTKHLKGSKLLEYFQYKFFDVNLLTPQMLPPTIYQMQASIFAEQDTK